MNGRRIFAEASSISEANRLTHDKKKHGFELIDQEFISGKEDFTIALVFEKTIDHSDRTDDVLMHLANVLSDFSDVLADIEGKGIGDIDE